MRRCFLSIRLAFVPSLVPSMKFGKSDQDYHFIILICSCPHPYHTHFFQIIYHTTFFLCIPTKAHAHHSARLVPSSEPIVFSRLYQFNTQPNFTTHPAMPQPTPASPRKLHKSPPPKPASNNATPYQEIHVLLLSWIKDDIGVAPQLDLLARVFSSVYNVTSIASCYIPSEDSEGFVRGALGGFLGRWDGRGDCGKDCGFDVDAGDEVREGDGMGEEIWIDGYGRLVEIEGWKRKLKRPMARMKGKKRAPATKKLLLIYYSGHGEVSKKEGGGLDWCAYKFVPSLSPTSALSKTPSVMAFS